MIPLLINFTGKRVLVVGAGPIAARRVAPLLAEGALVTCVSLAFSEEVKNLTGAGLCLRKKKYADSDLEKMDLVVAATNDQKINEAIKRACEQRSILCSRVDGHEDSDVIFPCVIRRGKLTIAVCTEGASPSLTKAIVKSLSHEYDESYVERLELLTILRTKILAGKKHEQQALLNQLAVDSLSELRNKVKAMDHLAAAKNNDKKTGEINDN